MIIKLLPIKYSFILVYQTMQMLKSEEEEESPIKMLYVIRSRLPKLDVCLRKGTQRSKESDQDYVQ